MDSEAATHSAGTASSSRPSADPLLPVLPILDPTVPLDRQQCVLKATKEARAFTGPKGFQASAGPKDLQTACDEAKRRCRLVTTTRPSMKLYLGQLVVPFGKYAGQSFMWLVANDVGYLKYLLDRHIAESQDPGRTGGTRENDWWLGMKEEDISSKALKRFRRFILDKEKQKAPTAAVPSSSLSGPVPSETVVPPSASVVPPSASASASVAPPTATSLSPWQDDALLSEALATFEGQADTAMAPPPDPPQQPQTDPVPPSQEPPSGPRKRTSKSAALPQPIEATVTQPEVSFEGWHKQWESGPQAHQALFPAILTPRRGVDKQVVRLMRDRTEGNTMVKVWRQVQEGHCEEYLQRKDLYTTLLCQLSRPGSIMSALGHQYQKPPTRRELPSPRLLRKAYLIYEAEHIEDYRTQIMSTFGKVLKYDSTRKRPQSVTSTSLPPAAELPDERPHTSRPQVQYESQAP
ncbi:unnamed protein product [Boreogadus saida]